LKFDLIGNKFIGKIWFMRILGIDYGEKKIGVAISDEKAKFAFPYSVIDNSSANSVLRALKIICDKNDVIKIILGQSLTFKMEPNLIMKRVEKFKSFIEERLNIPIEYESEILTTKQAKRAIESPIRGKQARCGRKGVKPKDKKIHASAAALILQGYLDRNA
jgi:putative Holliday junction resolvase